jgi:hypothetical protein
MKALLWRPGHRWDDYIKIYTRSIRYVEEEWIELDQDSVGLL